MQPETREQDPEPLESPRPTPTGFQGAVGSVPLVDLLQVWSQNRFSGLVTVSAGDESGRIYFADGAIVHAEARAASGEAAISTIVAWPQGSFELFPNTASLTRTIEKSVSHLLLDAHRAVDEGRRSAPGLGPPPGALAGPPPHPAPRPPAPQAPTPGPGAVERIRTIPDVLGAVRFGADGRPVSDGDAAAGELAARALQLALHPAAAVAEAFGLHGLSIASLRTAREALVLVHSAGQYLCVAVAPDAALEPVIAQLRAVLARPAAR